MKFSPAAIATGLFVASASFLTIIIGASVMGLTSQAHYLLGFAQPLCASAVAVLVYLVTSDKVTEQEDLVE